VSVGGSKVRLAACLATAAAAVSVHAPAASAAPEPLPITSMSPENGALISPLPPGYGESSWSVTVSPIPLPGALEVSVIVTLTPKTGTDGVHLSDTDLEQLCQLNPSGTDIGVYQIRGCTNNSHAQWTTIPGTYYWQFWGSMYIFSPCCEHREYVSPIFTITVGYPPPPPMESPSPQPAPAPSHPKCVGRYAKIGGRTTCLHSGATCYWRYRHQYTHYHYACVRRGSHYRLVRH
jgi:hypothetical protein